MSWDRIQFRNSITGHLLKFIIGGYLIVTVVVILIQLVSEYYHVKKSVVQEVQKLEITFGPGIKDALWINNFTALHSILVGMSEISIIAGVKIEDTAGKNIQSVGTVMDNKGKAITIDQEGRPIQGKKYNGFFSNLFVHEFPIKYIDGRGNTHALGKGTIYSSPGIVLDRIRHGFILIVVSAVIKTAALCALFIFCILKILGKPLGKLASDIEQVNLDNLEEISIHVETSGQNELKVLENRFNKMIRDLSVSRTKLHDYAKRYRNIFDNAVEGIFQSNTDRQVINVNPAMAEILGYDSPDDLLRAEKNILELCFAKKEDRKQCAWMLGKEGLINAFEGIGYRKDGTQFWGSLSVRTVLDDTNGATLIEGSFTDITARKQKEVADSKRKEAEASAKAQSYFLANMSHEIRTPMNAILGLSTLVLNTPLTAKQQDYISKIEISCKSLLGIINDILDFSKIEAGKLTIESINFNLEKELDTISNLIMIKAEQKGLEMLFNIDDQIPYNLLGDPLRLGQVLINLLSNAVKFTRTGQILLTIKPIDRLGTNQKDKVQLQFEVCDTGIGLAQDQMNNLFEAFSQADEGTTRQYGGTGLGLAISKQIVEMMNGKIWVESELGKGSTFIFTAEFGLQSEEKIKDHLEYPEDLQGLRVLVVDDNKVARQILSSILKSFNFKVDSVESGDKALEVLEKTSLEDAYKLILMDWKMPGLDGIETAKKIRASKHLHQMPAILMVSAYGRDTIMEKAKDAGINAFLLKPVNPSLLFDAIMEAFGKHSDNHQGILVDCNKNHAVLKEIRGAHILLVEDNKINQQVAQELLESQGLVVSVANNGLEAVEYLKSTISMPIYDAVLMDIQMPKMDGHTATREILKLEMPKIPIIALTAHAMVSEKEKCLASGMDDYISKPIEPEKLYAKLIKWIEPKPSFKPPLQKVSQQCEIKVRLPDEIPGIDINVGLSRVGQNLKLYKDLLLSFKKTSEHLAKDLCMELGNENYDLARRIAHTIKGVSGNLGALKLYQAATNLESKISTREIETLPELLEQFLDELSTVTNGLAGLTENETNSPSLAFDPEKVESLFDQLAASLETDYISAMDITKELGQYLETTDFKEKFTQLNTQMEIFDTKSAKQILAELTNSVCGKVRVG